MPSFAELKAKTSKMTSAGVEKVQGVRDRNTSVPMAKTNWDPYNGGPPPPPPPPRSLVNANTKPVPQFLPPPSRTSSAGSPSLSRGGSASPAPPLPSRSSSGSTPPLAPPRKSAPPAAPPRPSPALPSRPSQGPPPTVAGPPPVIRLSTRPGAPPRKVTPVAPVARATPATPAEPEIDWTNLSPEDKEVFFSWLDEFFANFKPKPTVSRVGNQSTSIFTLSHPPATKYGSAALDLANYFSPSTVWVRAWYDATDTPFIPPPIVGDKNHIYTSNWRSKGSSKSTNVGILFSDLSIFWGSVDFLTTSPEDPKTTKRSASYLSPPKALGREDLVLAYETYGDTIALFAESFVGSGQYCGRGECWDLANEGLKYFKDYDYIPKPVPSISRTHGHLIFEGRSDDNGRKKEGRWRGGDDRVRRGDIGEWRLAKLGRPNGYSTLGDPDHTAIIVHDATPKSAAKDGMSMSPSDLGTIVVIEQSQGSLPERCEYDLGRFLEGEMWIYRPIGMEAYLGVKDLTPAAPEGHLGLKRL